VRQIVRIKNDMPDALCVPITYIDNPSDSDWWKIVRSFATLTARCEIWDAK
jgi:hypothetical protein